jgi:serine/threonine protein kinase
MSKGISKVEALFQEAVALETAAERADYLSRACPDLALRREVESLLDGHQHPDRIFARDTIRVVFAEEDSLSPDGLYLGKTLDGKYRLERRLGQGGMGEVYLAIHLGTGRDVALKLIAPGFMRNPEFVERFKREARAAGRLRHPNIVDVTDFGVARVEGEEVAYLVMEYLDGCTLEEVLAEERRLPLPSVVTILEQVCSAVQQAHRQGIIHRDLKPANIWIEPNTLGGYRVKVLDFGIAKLAEDPAAGPALPASGPAPEPAPNLGATAAAGDSSTLTRAGGILGTPLFMSPEQCAGGELDARSDIYSLGVVAYQMLAGRTPFTGDPASVLRAHREAAPPPLEQHVRKLPRPVARVVMSALEKDPAARPPTALAFANALRANAEDIGALYRRSFALFSEYFPKIITLSLLAHAPLILATLLKIGLRMGAPWLGMGTQIGLGVISGLLWLAGSVLTGSVISGVVAVIVTQLTAAPLRPVSLRAAFALLRSRWRPFVRTGLAFSVRLVLGLILLVVPGLVVIARYGFWAPVVLLEGIEGKAALNRSRALTARSWRTFAAAVLFQFLLPVFIQWALTRLIGLGPEDKESVRQNVLSELITLSSIFVTPLISIVLALVYLKMRLLAGEEMAPSGEADVRPRWDQRLRARLATRASGLAGTTGW